MLRLAARFDHINVTIQTVLDVTPSDARALLALWDSDGLPATKLAQRVGLTTAATTTLIDRLERRGYAQRTRTMPDRRYVVVQITPLAEERLATVNKHFHERRELHRDDDTDASIALVQRIADETITVFGSFPIEIFPRGFEGQPTRTFTKP